MKRRELILGVGGALVAPVNGRAQQPRRIGLLRLAPADTEQFAAFRAGLEETGYTEGHNLTIEYRFAEGNYKRLPEMAEELVWQSVEVIVSVGGTDAVRAAMGATSTIPIVGSSVDTAFSGAPALVKHFNRPEGNVTGISIVTGDVVPKRMQILTELVPGAAIGVLMNPTLIMHERSKEVVEKAARALHAKLVIVPVSTDADLEPAFATLASQGVGTILPEAEPFLGNSWRRLVLLAGRYKIPMMQEWRHAVAGGGLLSYAPSLLWVYGQVGRYTGQILNGAKVADLPVIAPIKIELAINLKTAKALGLTVPQSILARADEVIE
jgi:ABC-type uncharacterized transport system substrate-binding protein